MPGSLLLWIIFSVVVLAMLAVDLKVFHRRAHEVKIAEAAIWSVVWIVLSLVFFVFLYGSMGKEPALKFLTGYIIEKSLSMDNLFVFLVIFRYFAVPAEYQHKVLFWGILGALFFRAVFIAVGITVIQMLTWTIYVLGAFLIYTGIKLALEKDHEIHPESNPAIRIFRRFMPVSTTIEGDHFFTTIAGRLAATPLFIALLVLETTDIVFATDSIPAILGITTDPFLVYSSNIFAILGLRALYFVLAGIMDLFRFLHYGLSIILVFVGAKMLVGDLVHMPVELELGIVGGILLVSIALSLLLPSKTDAAQPDKEQ